MPAFVEHSFTKSFLLDEERLRKLRDLIETRLTKLPAGPKLEYKIYRGDSYSYTTVSVDDVAKEDNEDWRRITRLDLSADKKDELVFLLSFSDKGCDLRITGADRDTVFLLFSDVRDYVQNEIMVATAPQPKSVRGISSILLLGFMLLVMFFTFYRMGESEEHVKQALQSSDMAVKVNFLIARSHRDDSMGRGLGLWVLPGILVVSLITLGFTEKLLKKVFPGNEFLFGKRKSTFTKRQHLISNIVWVGLVGLAVATVAGFIVWRVTTPH